MQHLYKKHILCALFGFLIATGFQSYAQVGNWEETHRGSVYFSLGYDKQWFASTNIVVKQGAANNYTLSGFTGTDLGPSNDFFNPLHYTYRLGYYFNYGQNAALEACFSPVRYYIADNQNLQVSGTYMGQPVKGLMEFQRDRNFKYFLDNGSGSIVVNFVKRFGLLRKVSHKFALDAVAKGGLGLMTPKVTYGFGAPATSVAAEVTSLVYNLEAGMKWTTHRHVFVELDYHYQMANLSDLDIAGGTVTQNLMAHTATLNLGYIFPVTRHNPMFSKGWPHRKEINHPKPMYRKEEDY